MAETENAITINSERYNTMDTLRAKFGGPLITRNFPVKWPPRSCDLTPLDYFLWGYVKSKVYANQPATLEELEDNIQRTLADMLHWIFENLRKWWSYSNRAVLAIWPTFFSNHKWHNPIYITTKLSKFKCFI